MGMTAAHYWIGYAVVGTWAVVAIWALVLRLVRAEESPAFWRFVAVSQVLLGIQLVAGVVLLLMGRLPAGFDWFDNVFHILYGIVFPVVVLVFAHRWSQEGRWSPHTIFAVAGLVLFGLTARAWMTGAGVG